MSLHFLVIEDQTLMRQFLVFDLRQRFAGCCVTEAGSLVEVRRHEEAGLAAADLAIVDLELPDGSALDWVAADAGRPLRAPVLLVSSVEEPHRFHRALGAGIRGFVHKHDGRAHLVLGVDHVLAGARYYSPTVLRLQRELAGDPAGGPPGLGAAEQRLLRLISEGHSDDEIAQIEGAKVAAVIAQRRHLLQQLALPDETQLRLYLRRHGLAQP